MNQKELDEIKLTLQRIQRIASEPIDETGVSELSTDGIAAAKPDEARAIGRFSDRAKQLVEETPAKLRSTSIAIAMLTAIGVIGLASWVFLRPNVEPSRKREETTELRTGPQERQAIQIMGDALLATTKAENLLDAGRVSEARRSLTDLADKSPEAALILARSYDPNYLRLIPNADAAADPGEAERWYRTWRDIAAKRGLVLEPDRFERIIKAMH